MSRSWVPETIVMSGITDCYQPVERKLRLTRGCLEVMREFGNPVAIITKNALVTRDIDVLSDLAAIGASHVTISVTSLDAELARDLEPRTSRPEARLKAIQELSQNGIPVSANVAPLIPGLNDHEIPAILKAVSEAGACTAHYTILRLPSTVLEVFRDWLEVHRPLRKDKILNMVRDLRGGKLNDARFGSRMKGQGVFAQQIRQMFKIYSQKYNLNREMPELSTQHFKKPSGPQFELF